MIYCFTERTVSDMEMILNHSAQQVLKTLEDAGFKAYIVGGAVRDCVMGITPSDYDIATNARPQQVKALFPRTIDTGLKHGTVTVVCNKTGFEVTTFRTEGEYKDMRHPEAVFYVDDIETDLKRRDFTVNAMAYSLKYGFLDRFGGISDIENRVIRCVGESEKRFKEDALRMLRAIRFAACLNFDIDENALAAIKKCAVLIKNVSGERILAELNKILLSDNPEKMYLLYKTGLMRYILPHLYTCFSTEQNNKYHIYNVGEHIIASVKNTPKDLILRWSALLHDIGKPVCQSRDANGIYHFYGHHKESMRIANDLLHRLRMDKDSIHDILVLIENHDVHMDSSPTAIKRMLARTGEPLFFKLLELQEADNMAKNPIYIKERLAKIRKLRERAQQIIAEGQPYTVSQLQINGRDLLKLGYKAGREVGDALKFLLDEVLIDPTLNNREYLIKRAIIYKRGRQL